MTSSARVFALLSIAWCLFLAVQWGDPFDETEHAHIAWKMAVERQTPVKDFFQHHQPLLWDVLEGFYLLGGSGPAVLYFGRAVIVVCAVVFAVALAWFGRGPMGGLWGLTPVVVVSLMFPSLWVARPEPLGMALVAVSFLLGTRSSEKETLGLLLLKSLVAGGLFMAALLASPRFLLLAGGFLLFVETWHRLAWRGVGWLLGAALTAGGYLVLRPYSLADVYFNLEASRVIAGIGEGYYKEVPPLIIAGVGFAGMAGVLAWQLPIEERRRFLIRVGYGLVVLLVSMISTGPYLYAQNLFAPLAWFAFTFSAVYNSRTRPSLALRAGNVVGVVVAGACLVLMLKDVLQGRTVVRHVLSKEALLQKLQPGDKVLLSSATHPIAVGDLSFYVQPLVDSRDRLPRTVKVLRQRWPLPPCDFLADIEKERPAVIDGFVLISLPPEQRRALQAILDREYEPLTPPVVEGWFLHDTLYLRRPDQGSR